MSTAPFRRQPPGGSATPGLRSSASGTLAVQAGVTSHIVAASLDHESITTTLQSYAKPEVATSAQQRRVLSVLQGGSGGKAERAG